MIRYTTLPDDSSIEGEHDGKFYNGLVTIKYPNYKFVGEMINNKRNGWGKTIYDDGSIYECFYENDIISTEDFHYSGNFEYSGDIVVTNDSTDLENSIIFHGKTGYLKDKNFTYIGSFRNGLFYNKSFLHFPKENISIRGYFIDNCIYGDCEIEGDTFYFEGDVYKNYLNGFGHLNIHNKSYYGIFYNGYLVYDYKYTDSTCLLCDDKMLKCTLLDCGHTFHNDCLNSFLSKKNTRPEIEKINIDCPECNVPMFDISENYKTSKIYLNLEYLLNKIIF